VAAKLGGYLTNIVMEHMGSSLCAAVYTSSVWRLVFEAAPHNRLLQSSAHATDTITLTIQLNLWTVQLADRLLHQAPASPQRHLLAPTRLFHLS
jgi:hypothetical protein